MAEVAAVAREANRPLAAPLPRVLRVVRDGFREGEARGAPALQRQVEGGGGGVAEAERRRSGDVDCHGEALHLNGGDAFRLDMAAQRAIRLRRPLARALEVGFLAPDFERAGAVAGFRPVGLDREAAPAGGEGRDLDVGAAEREAPALRGARQKRHGLGHVFALLLRARRRRAGSGSEKAAMEIAVQDRKERSRVFMGWDHQSV